MGCSSCGGGRKNPSGARAGGGRGVASRADKLPFLHIGADGSRTGYQTKAQAEAAKRVFGGQVEENK